jgi:hypothetical protein
MEEGMVASSIIKIKVLGMRKQYEMMKSLWAPSINSALEVNPP